MARCQYRVKLERSASIGYLNRPQFVNGSIDGVNIQTWHFYYCNTSLYPEFQFVLANSSAVVTWEQNSAEMEKAAILKLYFEMWQY